jgi:hypothetical protein
VLIRQITPRRAASLSTALALALVSAASHSAFAQNRLVLPAGSVLIVRTTSPLQSANAQVGQTFDTDVEQSVGIDEYTVIPAGSHIRGVITTVRPATRQESGVIEVSFDRLALANGSTVAIQGKLTSTDSAERRQIKSNPNARVALVGARGGIGAAIAGAGSGKGANSLFAALGGLLSEGRDVDVPAGTPLAVELQNSVTLRGGNRMRSADPATIYTAPERVSAAQQELSRRRYYRGAINGRLDDATRRALFQFQVDNRMAGTGNLDGQTAQALGLNLSGALAGGTLSNEAASSVRRDAQAIVQRERSALGVSESGRTDGMRSYSQGDIELWFALSAFADNAAVYEQVVRAGGSGNAAVLAGRALSAAARRVDSAMQGTRASADVQNAWSSIRQRLTSIDTSGN